MTSKAIISRMENHGYSYDTIDSYRGYLRFFYEGGLITFTTWKEVYKWSKEALI